MLDLYLQPKIICIMKSLYDINHRAKVYNQNNSLNLEVKEKLLILFIIIWNYIYSFITTLVLHHKKAYIPHKMICTIKSLYDINYRAKVYNQNKPLTLKVKEKLFLLLIITWNYIHIFETDSFAINHHLLTTDYQLFAMDYQLLATGYQLLLIDY